MKHKNDFLGNVLDKNDRTRNSKTPIYRACLGKEIRPGKSKSTVYRGISYTDTQRCMRHLKKLLFLRELEKLENYCKEVIRLSGA